MASTRRPCCIGDRWSVLTNVTLIQGKPSGREGKRDMRTRLGWIVGLAVVVFIGASFTLANAQAKPIKIGQIIPITGEAAESGKYHKQGAEIAVDKINAAGGINGRKIQIVLEDDQTTNPGGVAALQKLLEDKEIPVILGSIRSTQVQAMLPTINEAKIPVAIGGTNYGLTHSGSQWVFRFRPHDGMSAKVIAKFMVEELKQKKVGIVHASDAFGNGGRDMLTPAVKELGGEVVFTQGYNNQEKDFTAVVQGLKKSGATGARHLHDLRHGPRRSSPGSSSSRACR